jgi:hypothetical protein
MLTATDVGFIEMRIAKVVAFGPPLADEDFHCVVLVTWAPLLTILVMSDNTLKCRQMHAIRSQIGSVR